MSLRSKFLSILSLSIGLAVFSTAAIAQETTPTAPVKTKAGKEFKRDKMAGKADGEHHGKRGGKMHGLRGIDLTDAQKAQVKAIREANKPDQAVITELRTIREARKAGTAITPEQKDRMKAFREQRMVKAKSVHDQILAILTPEQKATLETRKTEMRQRMVQRPTDRKKRVAPATTDKPVIK